MCFVRVETGVELGDCEVLPHGVTHTGTVEQLVLAEDMTMREEGVGRSFSNCWLRWRIEDR